MGISVSDQMERAVVGQREGLPAGPGGTSWLLELTGATRRRLEWWIRHGHLGAQHQGLGSGSRRQYTAGDVEVVYALVRLAALGCTDHWLARAAEAVRSVRVAPVGERLIVPLEGRPYRHPISSPVLAQGPAWIVPLTACADGVISPAGGPLPHCNTPAGDQSKGAA